MMRLLSCTGFVLSFSRCWVLNASLIIHYRSDVWVSVSLRLRLDVPSLSLDVVSACRRRLFILGYIVIHSTLPFYNHYCSVVAGAQYGGHCGRRSQVEVLQHFARRPHRYEHWQTCFGGFLFFTFLITSISVPINVFHEKVGQ